jgi:glycosyltransferase involved in cell wall biosynthesis
VSASSRPNLKVTIGLCVKNAERTIHDCLKSIVNQSYPKELVTIIVVDGKSKDKTVEIAKEQLLYSGTASKFFSDNGAGLGFARQIAFENTNDRYIVWVDGDATILEDFVEKQVEFMERNRRVCVATGTHIHKGNTHTSLPASLESLGKYVGSAVGALAQEDRGIPPNDTSIYRVEAMNQVGGFDTNIRGASEDVDIITRMRRSGWTVAINKEAKYHVFPHASWQRVWLEGVWFGYGEHFLGHKHKDLHVCMYSIPAVYFYEGIKEGIRAYKLTFEKKSFLLPVNYVFAKIAWWYGFIKAHAEGYGHGQ